VSSDDDYGGEWGSPPAVVLKQIDGSTLPEDGWVDEVARRLKARKHGISGWRTGDFDEPIEEYGGGL